MHGRSISGSISGDSHAAGRGRQRLKLAAIAYVAALHGVHATIERANAARRWLREKAIEYVATLPENPLKNRRVDPDLGDSEMLELAAQAYAHARHGMDADVGMTREGMALLCQEATNYCESLPTEMAKRQTSSHFQLGSGI